MEHDTDAMVRAHKAGQALALNGATRDQITAMAMKLSTDEGDALIAGYYRGLRVKRIRTNGHSDIV